VFIVYYERSGRGSANRSLMKKWMNHCSSFKAIAWNFLFCSFQ